MPVFSQWTHVACHVCITASGVPIDEFSLLEVPPTTMRAHRQAALMCFSLATFNTLPPVHFVLYNN